MADDKDKKNGWIGRYGIPSLIVSVAALTLQQQQQTFDRLERVVEAGWQFYSGARTQLIHTEDADRELSVLKVIGNAFPNIYCAVRQDLYERAWAAQPQDDLKDGHTSIDASDLENLRREVSALSSPMRQPYPDNLIMGWTALVSPQHADCPEPNTVAAGSQKPGGASSPSPAGPQIALAPPMPPTAPASAAAPAADQKIAEAAKPTPSAAAAARSLAPNRGLGAPSAPAPAAPAAASTPASLPPIGAPPAMSPSPMLMRVFFHIRADGPRTAAVFEPYRIELASYNYRVIRGVERVAKENFPQKPEVRYFGEAEAPAAKQLAAYLSWKFSGEGLQFTPRAIGGSFPNLPHENIEVWVPNPPGAT